MNAFFRAIDLSHNLTLALRAVRSIVGIPAICMAVACGALTCLLAWASWYFDISSTQSWAGIAADRIANTPLGPFAPYLPALILIASFTPTIVELFTARFAMVGIQMAAALIYCFAAFDLVTDRERAFDFVASYGAAFDGFGLLAGPLMFVVQCLFLVLASFGFEMLTLLFLIVTLALMLNTSRQTV